MTGGARPLRHVRCTAGRAENDGTSLGVRETERHALWEVPGMAVAAFVLSVIAIAVAGVSAWYTRRQAAAADRQAVAAEEVRKLEAARRHEELQPSLVGKYVAASNTREGQRPGVKLVNEGPLDLFRVFVEVISADRADEAVIEGLYEYGIGGTAPGLETGMLRRGESWTFEVIPAQHVVNGGHKLDRGGTAAFRCACAAMGHEQWVVIVPVEFPATPWIY
jgi:hypothetical protein